MTEADIIMSTLPVMRCAAAEDEAFLIKHDHHVRPNVLRQLIEAGQILVAEDEGVLIGWLRWNLFWDEIPFMNMLFVLEHHRGHGLGSALMDAWETAARNTGHKAVMTSSQADEEAQHLYRKRGYVDCGALLLPDQAAEVIFRKEL
ncbi:MAG: GNAT family N-acetyltransferase [Thermomicrobiales bacterium]|nr:GNAT family N-acetyltransferase [Thermomicrobiales bacterium]